MDQASSLRKMVSKKALEANAQISGRGRGSLDFFRMPRVLSVTSGKGGVGKTNICGNLALAFRSLNKKVLIIDADIGLANIDIIYGISPRYNLSHVLSGEKELSEIVCEGPKGIKIIPAGSGFVNYTHLTDGQKLNLLEKFESLEDLMDICLIDTAGGISSNVLYFNVASDESVVVVTSEPTSITDAYALIKVMSSEYGKTHFKLIINMVENVAEAKAVYMKLTNVIDKFLKNVEIEYVGFVPFDQMMKTAVKNRKPILDMYPTARASMNIKNIASSILNSKRRFDTDGNIKFFMKRFMELGK